MALSGEIRLRLIA